MHNPQHRTVMMNGTYDVQVSPGYSKGIQINRFNMPNFFSSSLINVLIIHTYKKI